MQTQGLSHPQPHGESSSGLSTPVGHTELTSGTLSNLAQENQQFVLETLEGNTSIMFCLCFSSSLLFTKLNSEFQICLE